MSEDKTICETCGAWTDCFNGEPWNHSCPQPAEPSTGNYRMDLARRYLPALRRMHADLCRENGERLDEGETMFSFAVDAIQNDKAQTAHIEQMEAENARIRARNDELSTMMEGRFSDLRLVRFENGEVTFEGPMIPMIAEGMAQMLKPTPDAPAANYTETRMVHNTLGELVMTIQRVSGQTPHVLRKAADRRAQVAEARLAAVREKVSEGADPGKLSSYGDPGVLRDHFRDILEGLDDIEADGPRGHLKRLDAQIATYEVGTEAERIFGKLDDDQLQAVHMVMGWFRKLLKE